MDICFHTFFQDCQETSISVRLKFHNIDVILVIISVIHQHRQQPIYSTTYA